MGIADEDIQKVRDASDIVAIISQHLALKRVGRRWVGLCPFHAEKSPSFSVNQELGLYYCFGCQARGDAITFVREMQHLDFVGAVEYLAGKAGIALTYTDRDQGEGRRKRAELRDAVASAVDWYHDRLLSADDAAPARSYLRSRGFDGEMVRAYQLGWAPDAWDELSRALETPAEVLVRAGLAFMNRRNRPTDSFRGRLLFPIFDPQGDAVGFGGRILPGGEGPKYKNSPESSIYQKSKVLYGLNWHKAAIVEVDEAVICEGYTDVIGFSSAGVARSVATCGTALTEDHVRLLKRFAKRFILAFDADSAGQAAAERFYEWEREHEIDVAVADLPTGVDPGELALSDPARLKAAVDEAVPFLQFRVDRVLSKASLDRPEGRAKAAEAALAVIAEHPSELVRDQYLMEVADRCRVDPDNLRATARSPRPAPTVPSRRADEPAPLTARAPVHESVEIEALRIAVHDPASVAGHLDEILFTDDDTLGAYRALAGAATLHEALDGAEPGAGELLRQLAVEEPEAEPIDVVGRLVDDASRREVAALEVAARRSEDPLVYAADIGLVKLLAEQLREDANIEAADELVAWMRQRAEEGHD